MAISERGGGLHIRSWGTTKYFSSKNVRNFFLCFLEFSFVVHKKIILGLESPEKYAKKINRFGANNFFCSKFDEFLLHTFQMISKNNLIQI